MPSTAQLALRGLTALAIAAFLVGGPALSQVGRVRSDYLPQWVMFTGFGLDVCAVDYWLVHPDGSTEPLDRFSVLGVDAWREGPRKLWRVPNEAWAVKWGQRMCAELAESRPDLRARVRCAERGGWSLPLEGATNLCAARGARPGRAR